MDRDSLFRKDRPRMARERSCPQHERAAVMHETLPQDLLTFNQDFKGED